MAVLFFSPKAKLSFYFNSFRFGFCFSVKWLSERLNTSDSSRVGKIAGSNHQIPNECINRYANTTNVFYVSCVNYLCLVQFSGLSSHIHKYTLRLSMCATTSRETKSDIKQASKQKLWLHFAKLQPKISFIPLL